MNILRKNILANYAGNIWQAIMGLAFIPIYIKLMGIESYGLIGIFASLLAVLGILDMGLSATLSRETARLSVLPGKEQEMRDLVRSMEVIYWCVAISIACAVVFASPFIAHRWIQAGQLPPGVVEQALRIMGLAMALQWPAALYSGGLLGLQEQVLLNAINIVMCTLRSAGAVLVLYLISPTIQAFFSWQLLVSITTTLLLAIFLWRKLPVSGKRPAFQKQLIAGIWRFAAGMSGIAILSTIFTQLDKIILSKMLSLEMFGYYTLASTVAMTLVRLVGPIFSAIYPRLTQLCAIDDQAGLTRLYHKSCQLVSVIVFPVSFVIAAFSFEILLIWTQNPQTAEKTHLLVSIVICGSALFGLLHVPYALQLASGWVRLPFYTNLAAIIVYIPGLIFMTTRYGALGAAATWVFLNVVEMIIPIYFMHKRLLTSEKARWYWQDICVPLLTTLAVVCIGRISLSRSASQVIAFFSVLVISLSSLTVTSLSTPITRTWIFDRMANFRLHIVNRTHES